MRYGCRVAERILEHGTERWASNFFQHVIDHAKALVMTRYGNYVVTYFLQHNNKRHDCALSMIPWAKRIASTKSGFFVLRFGLAHCDEEMRAMFEERGGNNCQILRATRRRQ